MTEIVLKIVKRRKVLKIKNEGRDKYILEELANIEGRQR